MDYQDGRTILHGAWFFAFAAKFLGKIRLVSVAAGFEAKEKYARLLLARRSPERHSLAAKHRAERALVFHRASRTRPRILLQSLFPPGSSLLVRLGAAPGFHEGVGELISLASSQVPYLQSRGVLPHDFKADKTAFLLDDALARSVPFIYFSCGTMPHWEADIYAHNLPPINGMRAGGNTSVTFKASSRHRRAAKNFAMPPPRRTSTTIRPITTTMRLRPCFKFQLHDYIARKILHQPPQSCNYADNKEVGAWLNNILKKGGTEDWRKVLKEATGEDISTRAMMDYFKPLMGWLEEQNKGRQIGWD